MKKIIIICLTAIMALSASAQDSKFRFGLRGGVNMTEFSLKNTNFDTDNRVGFFVGPTIKFSLPVVGLGVDLSALYNHKESKLDDETVKLNTVDIPLNLRYSIGLGSLANIFVSAGPQIAFNLGDKEVDLDNVNDWRFKDSYFSVNVGGGLTISHIELSARYNIPIGNTSDARLDDVTEKVLHAKTNNWQVGLAYYF